MHYNIIKEIGSGSEGTVYEATNVKNEKVALKVFFKNNNVPGIPFLREACLLESLSDNYISLSRCINYDTNQIDPNWYIGFEMDLALCDITNAVNMPGVTNNNKIRFVHDMLNAVNYLKCQQLIHQDIKPNNFLIYTNPVIVKLCDMGHAIRYNPWIDNRNNRIYVHEHRPPEIFVTGNCTPASDVWALGITIYWLFTFSFPFNETTSEKMVELQLSNNLATNQREYIKMYTKFIESTHGGLCINYPRVSTRNTLINTFNKLSSKWDSEGERDNIRSMIMSMLDFLPENRPSCRKIIKDYMKVKFIKIRKLREDIIKCRKSYEINKNMNQVCKMMEKGEIGAQCAFTTLRCLYKFDVPISMLVLICSKYYSTVSLPIKLNEIKRYIKDDATMDDELPICKIVIKILNCITPFDYLAHVNIDKPLNSTRTISKLFEFCLKKDNVDNKYPSEILKQFLSKK